MLLCFEFSDNDNINAIPAAFTPCVSVSVGLAVMNPLPAFYFFSIFVETSQVYFSEFR
jgi:hypothetical protein